LYFGSLMTYWECRNARRTEDLPAKQLDLPFAAILRKFGSRTGPSMSGRIDSVQSAADEDLTYAPQNETELDKFEERWADLVEFYTAREMTYPEKDRLVAISGIMALITAETGQQFVYGLLVSRLVTELLWWQWCDCHGDIEKLPERTTKHTKVPTWSWGSTTGRISPFRSSRYLRVNRRDPWRLKATCTLSYAEQTSLPASSASTTEPVCVVTFSSFLFEACVLSRVDLRHYNWKLEVVGQTGYNSWIIFEAQIWPDEPLQQGMSVWLLELADIDALEGFARPFAGLAIVPVATPQTTDQWKRVGYFEMSRPQPLATPSDSQRARAWRTALNHKVKCIHLV
jgi:hypothetical protein